MTEMHKHLLGAAYQLAAFRDALAIARQAYVHVVANNNLNYSNFIRM